MTDEAVELLRDATSRPWLADELLAGDMVVYRVTLPRDWLERARHAVFGKVGGKPEDGAP